jgi:hypothetical protein
LFASRSHQTLHGGKFLPDWEILTMKSENETRDNLLENNLPQKRKMLINEQQK